jgi:hypothetical protein
VIGTSFCRQTYSHGGVCVLVQKNIQFNTIKLDQYNKEKDLEICALKLNIGSINLTIDPHLATSPIFLNQLEAILNKIHKPSKEFSFSFL